jgi:predicted permease
MSNLGVVFTCLGSGWLAGFAAGKLMPKRNPATGAGDLFNWIALRISLPCLAFRLLHDLSSLSQALLPAAVSWIILAAAIPFFALAGYTFGWSRAWVGAVILAAGFGNTSFVGFPLLVALRGEGALRTGVIVDQFGSFLAVTTAGFAIAAIYASRKPRIFEILFRVLTFPSFVAAVVGLATRDLSVSPTARVALTWGGATLAPLALLSVGLHIGTQMAGQRLRDLTQFAVPIAVGLVFKLLVAPALIAVLYLSGFHMHGEVAAVSILEAAMAPMVTGAVIAREEGLAPELASLLIGVGIPLSLLTVPGWDWVLRTLGV